MTRDNFPIGKQVGRKCSPSMFYQTTLVDNKLSHLTHNNFLYEYPIGSIYKENAPKLLGPQHKCQYYYHYQSNRNLKVYMWRNKMAP